MPCAVAFTALKMLNAFVKILKTMYAVLHQRNRNQICQSRLKIFRTFFVFERSFTAYILAAGSYRWNPGFYRLLATP